MNAKHKTYRTVKSVADVACFNCATPVDPASLRNDGYPRGTHSAACPRCGMRTWFDVKKAA